MKRCTRATALGLLVFHYLQERGIRGELHRWIICLLAKHINEHLFLSGRRFAKLFSPLHWFQVDLQSGLLPSRGGWGSIIVSLERKMGAYCFSSSRSSVCLAVLLSVRPYVCLLAWLPAHPPIHVQCTVYIFGSHTPWVKHSQMKSTLNTLRPWPWLRDLG